MTSLHAFCGTVGERLTVDEVDNTIIFVSIVGIDDSDDLFHEDVDAANDGVLEVRGISVDFSGCVIILVE